MNVLIVGAKGFIGKNLFFRLKENKMFNILLLDKNSTEDEKEEKISKADLIFLLFGVNKEKLPNYTFKNNYLFTEKLCSILRKNNKKTSIIFASSIQANQNNLYGKSKLKAEKILLEYKKETRAKVIIYRLPNVFGKWSKPLYNSVVATFCFNISRNKKIRISNNNKIIKLLYIDDLIENFINQIRIKKWPNYANIKETHNITLLKLADLIRSFDVKDKTYLPSDVSKCFIKKIFSTYVSFFPKNKFKYKLKRYSDNRGSFIEFLKNEQFGQFSYFSILPKKIRGNHFHHTKLEKFIVISGKVRFNFVNIINKKKFSILSDENKNLVINTVPGWAHNIENVSFKNAKILAWSNEILNKKKTDTFFFKL
jgi:UDP-2-acetamido-2,6-beta-L-arabino-hexul-4-ose reductase